VCRFDQESTKSDKKTTFNPNPRAYRGPHLRRRAAASAPAQGEGKGERKERASAAAPPRLDAGNHKDKCRRPQNRTETRGEAPRADSRWRRRGPNGPKRQQRSRGSSKRGRSLQRTAERRERGLRATTGDSDRSEVETKKEDGAKTRTEAPK
jgi:hypothetical protein